MDYSAHLWLSRTMISLDYAFMPRIARLWRNNGRLVGERQQFLKFSQCLSALTAAPAEREESTPPKWGARSLPTTPALSAWPREGWHRNGFLAAGVCRACTLVPASSPTLPAFQTWCGAEGLCFSLPRPHPFSLV